MLLPIAAIAQNDLYKRYASRQDITVAQVSGFKLNESERVDVVIVVADNEAAWRKLAEELNIKGEDGVVSWLGDTKKPEQRMKWTGGLSCAWWPRTHAAPWPSTALTPRRSTMPFSIIS